jgi:hypothetical protein
MYDHDMASGPALNYSVVFSRMLPDHSIEQVTDTTMPATGRYNVRLVPGHIYRATLDYGRCNVEVQEYAVANTGNIPLVKNFYLNYTDTTGVDHSHCLKGRKTYR